MQNKPCAQDAHKCYCNIRRIEEATGGLAHLQMSEHKVNDVPRCDTDDVAVVSWSSWVDLDVDHRTQCGVTHPLDTDDLLALVLGFLPFCARLPLARVSKGWARVHQATCVRAELSNAEIAKLRRVLLAGDKDTRRAIERLPLRELWLGDMTGEFVNCYAAFPVWPFDAVDTPANFARMPLTNVYLGNSIRLAEPYSTGYRVVNFVDIGFANRTLDVHVHYVYERAIKHVGNRRMCVLRKDQCPATCDGSAASGFAFPEQLPADVEKEWFAHRQTALDKAIDKWLWIYKRL
jgi:hypothetical protein